MSGHEKSGHEKALYTQNAILVINDGSDVQVLMSVDDDDDARGFCVFGHLVFPSCVT